MASDSEAWEGYDFVLFMLNISISNIFVLHILDLSVVSFNATFYDSRLFVHIYAYAHIKTHVYIEAESMYLFMSHGSVIVWKRGKHIPFNIISVAKLDN